MLTPKQKATLKGLANPIHQRYLIGKGEIDDGVIALLNTALESRELIKVGLLANSSQSPEALGGELERQLGCDVVQVIGRVIVLYRRNKKNPKIVI